MHTAYTIRNKSWKCVGKSVSWDNIFLIKTMKGLDTVESLSAGAAWLKVWYPRKNIGIISIAQNMCWVLS